MQPIGSTKKYESGIQVFWKEEGKDLNDFFSYSDLIDMKINALDLLEHPGVYRIDAKMHKIQSAL